MHTATAKTAKSKAHVVTTRVRTSISLSPQAQQRGKALMEAEGFPNFSEMVEYLIRVRSERGAVA